MSRKFIVLLAILFTASIVLLAFITVSKKQPNAVTKLTEKKASPTIQLSKMKITSSAFEHNSSIPKKYSCDGENINPPLHFEDIPEDTQSLALLMEDPDVPKNLKPDGMFDHWVVYNMPPKTNDIKEGTTPPGKQGANGAGKNSYTGPCPPDREHRYFFKLYALNTMLDLPNTTDKAMVEEAMRDHILDQAELIGLYNRK